MFVYQTPTCAFSDSISQLKWKEDKRCIVRNDTTWIHHLCDYHSRTRVWENFSGRYTSFQYSFVREDWLSKWKYWLRRSTRSARTISTFYARASWEMINWSIRNTSERYEHEQLLGRYLAESIKLSRIMNSEIQKKYHKLCRYINIELEINII